jgi:hypothetical protein
MTSSPALSTADRAENRLPVSAALVMWRKGVPGIASPVSQATDRAAMVSSIPHCVTRVGPVRCDDKMPGRPAVVDQARAAWGTSWAANRGRIRLRPTSARCRARPSGDIVDGSTDRQAS